MQARSAECGIEKTRLFVIPKTNFLKLLKSQLILADKIIEESKNHQQELESRRQELAQRKLISIEEIGKNILDWFKDRLMREITKEN